MAKAKEKFMVSGVFRTKREAQQEAGRVRRVGYHARVAKTADGWTTYKGDHSLLRVK